MEKMQEAFNIVNTITKDMEEIKNKQKEMNNTNFRLTMQLGTMDITIRKSQQSRGICNRK